MQQDQNISYSSHRSITCANSYAEK